MLFYRRDAILEKELNEKFPSLKPGEEKLFLLEGCRKFKAPRFRVELKKRNPGAKVFNQFLSL